MGYCEELDTVEQVMQPFEAFVASLSYQRNEEDLLNTLKRVRFKVAMNSSNYLGVYNSNEGLGYYDDDDAVTLYGYLVLVYGEYGTAPRSGWISNCAWFIDDIITYLSKLINEQEEVVKRKGEE